MQRIMTFLILTAFLAIMPAFTAKAWFFDDDTLVTIDGQKYTAEDFKRWWNFYKEKDTPFLESPDSYVKWLLLKREAKGMGLDEAPDFQRQTRIFLQSRGLLMLKYEAVDSNIKVTEADVKKRYEEKFLPRWQVQPLTFKDEEAAMAAWQELAAGTLTVDELVARNAEEGGPVSTRKNWLRPSGIDQEWTAIFRKMEPGQVVDPTLHDKGKELYLLVDRKGADDEDFAKWKEEIKKRLWKEEENRLTQALLDELRNKYEVKIDKERLAALDLQGDEESFTEAPLITTNRQNVSEKEFISVIKRLLANRAPIAHALTDKEETLKLKEQTVDNIIAQSLTNWESLDRHYEEKEPFKWEYEFNYNYRLVKALENRLFSAEAAATEEEVKQHYQENIQQYTQPTMVSLYILHEEQAPIDQIWADTAIGKDFIEILKQLDLELANREVPAEYLAPEVKTVVDKLAEGETSQIFNSQGTRVLVHLVRRTPEAPVPLERIQETIRLVLEKKKIQKKVDDYFDALKSSSEIEIRDGQWEAIQKELGGTNES